MSKTLQKALGRKLALRAPILRETIACLQEKAKILTSLVPEGASCPDEPVIPSSAPLIEQAEAYAVWVRTIENRAGDPGQEQKSRLAAIDQRLACLDHSVQSLSCLTQFDIVRRHLTTPSQPPAVDFRSPEQERALLLCIMKGESANPHSDRHRPSAIEREFARHTYWLFTAECLRLHTEGYAVDASCIGYNGGIRVDNHYRAFSGGSGTKTCISTAYDAAASIIRANAHGRNPPTKIVVVHVSDGVNDQYDMVRTAESLETLLRCPGMSRLNYVEAGVYGGHSETWRAIEAIYTVPAARALVMHRAKTPESVLDPVRPEFTGYRPARAREQAYRLSYTL
ncbi:MAG: hypothetical protein EOM26_11490 [Alphaproteobacteria bacterium]|nr:hypothetical protein [Alphaproteobacteria bacterium]